MQQFNSAHEKDSFSGIMFYINISPGINTTVEVNVEDLIVQLHPASPQTINVRLFALDCASYNNFRNLNIYC